jgi:NAD(P)-dependent dehydrogenase (short-subunit alcohol dehydrogenase family)
MPRDVVVVTGASTGIGRESAVQLAQAGYDVIPVMRRDEPLPEPVLAPVLIDLSDADAVGPGCRQIRERAGGRLVGLVNNAGINISGPFEATPLSEWRRAFEVNLFSALAVTQALLPDLVANRGRVVTIGSIGGRMSVPFLAPYSASKAAVRSWTDALRLELRPHGVQVVLIEPGAIATPMWRKGNEAADERIAALNDEHRVRYADQITSARKAATLAERHAIPVQRCA